MKLPVRPGFLAAVCLAAAPFVSGTAVSPAPSAAAASAPIAAPASSSAAFAIDFSVAGYAAGVRGLPAAPAVLRLAPSGSDDTARLRAALAAVAATPGERRALLLAPGEFLVEGQLRLDAPGVVLRGSLDEAGRPVSVLRATGTDRRAVLRLGAKETPPVVGSAVHVAAVDVPVGATLLPVADVAGFAAGARVRVRRPGTKAWFDFLGVNRPEGNFPQLRVHWLTGARDVTWDRTVVAVDAAARTLALDAPLTTALEPRFGGGTVAVLASAPPREIGVEQLVLVSDCETNPPGDEDHAWIGVQLDAVEDAWVRGVVFRQFVGSAVRVGPGARRVTVAACRSEAPVSELAGYRRQTFLVEGSQALVRDCTSAHGRNDFVLGALAAGPNVFRDCTATDAHGPSGAFESWASGALFERVRIAGGELRLTRDDATTQGGGWTAANCVVRDCTATAIVVASPPGAAVLALPADAGAAGADRADAPLPAFAALPEFTGAPAADPPPAPRQRPRILGGRFVVNDRALWGGQFNAAWWKGQTSPALAAEAAGRSITRFVPGREGRGLTEDLGQLADDMRAAGAPFYAAIPGLWYDRRRDDHAVTARAAADVWAPFYELPWRRTGTGTAWDGLSRYDLGRFNPWYFARTEAFARECERRGLVCFVNLYNAHNVYETQAHWVDFPWRPANHVNATELPEPPPLDEGNAVHLGDQVFDVSHPVRRRLHAALINEHLRTLATSTNVVLCAGFQFAGPREFQEFFLDRVEEFGAMTARRYWVALATSKDITDAILADPRRAALVNVIDTRYWQTQPDGTEWAPRGDVNRAFREQNAQRFGKGLDTPPDTTPLAVYRGVRAYRDKFPDKAIVAWHGGAGPIPVLMAGGALALRRNPAAGQSQGTAGDAVPFDAYVREQLAAVLPAMVPQDGWLADAERNWCLADPEGRFVLCYSVAGETIGLARDLPQPAYRAEWFDPRTGATTPLASFGIRAGAVFTKPTSAEWVLRLTQWSVPGAP